MDLFYLGDEKSKQSLEFKIDQDKAFVYELAFSPDRKQLLAAGSVNSKGWLAIWNLPIQTNAEPDMLQEIHSKAVTCMSFSPDGRALLTGSEDKTLKLWEFPMSQSSNPIRVFSGHNGPVWDCDFSPDETKNRFVSCSDDKTVRIWSWDMDGIGSTKNWLFKEHKKAVYSVAFSKDGHQIASAGMEQEIRIWTIDRSSYEMERYYTKIKNQIDLIYPKSKISKEDLVSEIKKQVLLTNERRVTLLNNDMGKEWNAVESDSRVIGRHANSIRVLEFSENGKFLLSAGDDNIVNVWNV